MLRPQVPACFDFTIIDNIFKNTYSILICQSFPFTLVQSFRSNRDGDVGK